MDRLTASLFPRRRGTSRRAAPGLLLSGTLLAWAAAAPAAAPATAATSAQAAGKTPSAATAPSPATAAGSAARAAEEVPLPKSPVPPFAKADTNHDGKIDQKEAQAVKVPKKLFDHFDFDHNGSLSHTEWLFVRLHMTDFTPPKATVTAPAAATHKK